MTPEQRSAYIAQQMSQFQAVQEQVTSKCSQTKASPPSSQPMMPPRGGLLPKNLSPTMIPPTRHQSPEGRGLASPTPGKQQEIFHCSPPFPIPSHAGQNPLGGLGPGCRRLQIPKASPSEAPLPGFCPRPPGSQSPSPHQLRQPRVPRMPAALNRGPPLGHVDDSDPQHFESNSVLAQAPTRLPLVAPAFPSQAGGPPNQVAPGGRPGQKVNAALLNPCFGLLGNQSPCQSPVRGPVPVLSATKSPQQGLASFAPLSPIQGIEPPSYVVAAAAAAAATAFAIAASQSPGPLGRMGAPPELPPYGFLPPPQPPLDGLISPPDCSEADFIEDLLKGPSVSLEGGWVCNLRLIDDILEEHAAATEAGAAEAAARSPGGT